jgi:hypothetical protein
VLIELQENERAVNASMPLLEHAAGDAGALREAGMVPGEEPRSLPNARGVAAGRCDKSTLPLRHLPRFAGERNRSCNLESFLRCREGGGCRMGANRKLRLSHVAWPKEDAL